MPGQIRGRIRERMPEQTRDAGCRGGCGTYSRSMIVAFAMPPPSHMACRP